MTCIWKSETASISRSIGLDDDIKKWKEIKRRWPISHVDTCDNDYQQFSTMGSCRTKSDKEMHKKKR